ncbi:WD repeat-containing protein 76 [Sceloporus undulatus]|uniref:WD repeat-containing protein 76 n=1 Tax=Sceloporus undulatus TaxID=8520 RepID=UPI001C4C6BE1|nr:WD repeat-containing protein 76 [Sceloporus undulatus]
MEPRRETEAPPMLLPAKEEEEEEEEKERTPKENPRLPPPIEGHLRSKALLKQVRIHLTPVSVGNGGDYRRYLSQKRCLLEQFSSSEGLSSPEPSAKRACDPPPGSQSHPETSQEPGMKASSQEQRSSDAASAASAIQSETENEDRGPESGREEEEESAELSAYERKRLKNITENAEFFASLKLFESAARLRGIVNKEQTRGTKRVKPSKAETETACRRSMRLQRVDPTGLPLPEPQAHLEMVEEHPCLPPGPLPMVSADQEQTAERIEGFLETWAKISQVEPKKTEKAPCGLESYEVNLHRMVLGGDAVAKVVRSRIYSVAVHPSESRTLVAAGDKWGQVGLWDLDSTSGEDGVHAFAIHSQPVSCMYFSPFNPAHLLSLSHDGTLRNGDVTRAVFDEVYRNEECSLSAFDFLDSEASTLIVGMWDGKVAVVDRRTPGSSSELSADLNSTTRTVHVHPVDRHYFVSAGARSVGIYDVRHLKKSGSKPVVSLTGHTKSVASAYFSPITGNRVLTTCADDKLRIFGTKCLSSLAPTLRTIKHNNNTGRWLTRFRAVWDPKRDDCFVVGSMSRPRQIQAFHVTGELVRDFLSEDYLGSVCSINAWHPTRYILAGGNSSGRLHVFKD